MHFSLVHFRCMSFQTTTTTTTQRPTTQTSQALVRFPEYEEIEIITAPPLGGHSNYKPTYEVQVSYQ